MGPHPTVVHPEYKPRADGTKMKALAWFGADDVRLVDAPVPDITEADDVIIRVTGTTICDSDLHLYHGEMLALGDILGHEVCTQLYGLYLRWHSTAPTHQVHGPCRRNRP
jgi:hypothetical protein